MEKFNVNDLIKEIKENNYNNKVDVSCLCDYNGALYLSDTINEICDNYIDIYYNDLFEWAKGNISYINDAVGEFGACDDIVKMIQQGQYMANYEEVRNNIDDMLHLYVYDILQKEGIETISQSTISVIDEITNNMDVEDNLPNYNEVLEALAENIEEDKNNE